MCVCVLLNQVTFVRYGKGYIFFEFIFRQSEVQCMNHKSTLLRHELADIKLDPYISYMVHVYLLHGILRSGAG